MTPRRIAVVTGTRAEYGLLRWLLRDIRDHHDLELSLIVTGSHLSQAHGATRAEIEADGFLIDAAVEILDGDDSGIGTVHAASRAVAGIGDALAQLKPDLVVVLGDRYEILAASLAAVLLRIPVAHIAGGEITEGAWDDSIRHAITKLAHLHFTATESYRRRVVQLGESPERVVVVGAMGLDAADRLDLLDRPALSESLGFDLGGGPLAVATFHPETLAGEDPVAQVRPLLDALDEIPELRVVVTKANADPGGLRINEELERHVAERSDRMTLVASLGQLRYLSLLEVADVVVGNSSSGIVEAPAAGVPTVDIGDRQRGRLAAPSILHVENEHAAILAGIRRALGAEMREVAARRESPYGGPGAAGRIVDHLASAEIASLRTKTFHDMEDPT